MASETRDYPLLCRLLLEVFALHKLRGEWLEQGYYYFNSNSGRCLPRLGNTNMVITNTTPKRLMYCVLEGKTYIKICIFKIQAREKSLLVLPLLLIHAVLPKSHLGINTSAQSTVSLSLSQRHRGLISVLTGKKKWRSKLGNDTGNLLWVILNVECVFKICQW